MSKTSAPVHSRSGSKPPAETENRFSWFSGKTGTLPFPTLIVATGFSGKNNLAFVQRATRPRVAQMPVTFRDARRARRRRRASRTTRPSLSWPWTPRCRSTTSSTRPSGRGGRATRGTRPRRRPIASPRRWRGGHSVAETRRDGMIYACTTPAAKPFAPQRTISGQPIRIAVALRVHLDVRQVVEAVVGVRVNAVAKSSTFATRRPTAPFVSFCGLCTNQSVIRVRRWRGAMIQMRRDNLIHALIEAASPGSGGRGPCGSPATRRPGYCGPRCGKMGLRRTRRRRAARRLVQPR